MSVKRVLIICTFCVSYSTGQPESLGKIREWWKEMSVMKPIHCGIPKNWDNISGRAKKSFLFAEISPILSYPCEKLSDETSVPYKYHGKLNNNLFHGPGKVVLEGDGLATSNEVNKYLQEFILC